MFSRFLRFPAILALATAAALTASADTVTLKSGETFSGKLIYEDEQHVVIDVPVSAGVTDQRRVMRTDIATIEKDSAEATDFAKIESLKPGATSLAPEQYDVVIQRLAKFQETYPDGHYKKVIADRIAAFGAEKERVAGGEVEIGGEWITKEDAEKRRYQIAARLVFEQMLQSARRGDYIAALNTFDRIESKYPGSRAYVEAVPVAMQTVSTLSGDIARRKKALAHDLEVREQGILITSEPRKSELIAAGQREEAQDDAALAAAEAAGLAWPPLISRSMKSLEAIEAKITEAETRLAGIPLVSMKASVAEVDDAKRLIADKDFDGAEASLKEAATLWSQNESVPRWQGVLAVTRDEATKEAETLPGDQPDAAAESTPAATPVAIATPVGAPAEPETPFFLTIPGAATILVAVVAVIGLIALLGRVKKGAPSAPEEKPQN